MSGRTKKKCSYTVVSGVELDTRFKGKSEGRREDPG
jgi:hypothetical protein